MSEEESVNGEQPLDDSAVDPRDQKLADLTHRLKLVSRKYQDQVDEMASFRTRMEERSRIEQARRRAEIVRTFFDPVQNLGRVLDASGDVDSLRQGAHLVHKQFIDVLDTLGLAPVPGVGSYFNPDLHEAIAVDMADDPAKDNLVSMVHLGGWMVGGRAIEVAKVSVWRYVPPAEE